MIRPMASSVSALSIVVAKGHQATHFVSSAPSIDCVSAPIRSKTDAGWDPNSWPRAPMRFARSRSCSAGPTSKAPWSLPTPCKSFLPRNRPVFQGIVAFVNQPYASELSRIRSLTCPEQQGYSSIGYAQNSQHPF